MMFPFRHRKSVLTLPREDVFAVSDELAVGSAAPSRSDGAAAHDITGGSTTDRSHHQDLDSFTRTIAAGLAGGDRRVWCTITARGPGQPETIAVSGERARALEARQLRFADGPCMRAVRDQVLIHVGDTATDARWRPYAAATLAQGVRSVLAVPFELAGVGPASLNLRCNRPHAFDSAQIGTVQQLLQTASDVAREVTEQLPEQGGAVEPAAAAASRTLTKQALSRLMEQYCCTEEEAFHLLRTVAERRGMYVHELAAELVAATFRRG